MVRISLEKSTEMSYLIENKLEKIPLSIVFDALCTSFSCFLTLISVYVNHHFDYEDSCTITKASVLLFLGKNVTTCRNFQR